MAFEEEMKACICASDLMDKLEKAADEKSPGNMLYKVDTIVARWKELKRRSRP